MANREHLAKIKKGVAAWNDWRKTNKEIVPHLSGADLYGADLSMANLSTAQLGGAYLTGANLSGADLSRASVSDTIFRGNDLSDVKGLETVRHDGPSMIGIDNHLSPPWKNPAEIPARGWRSRNLH